MEKKEKSSSALEQDDFIFVSMSIKFGAAFKKNVQKSKPILFAKTNFVTFLLESFLAFYSSIDQIQIDSTKQMASSFVYTMVYIGFS